MRTDPRGSAPSRLAISIAFLNLLYGVMWLFEAWELRVAASVTAPIAGLVAPCVTFVFIGLRALDMRAVATGSHHERTWLLWLLGLLLAGIVLSYVLSLRAASASALTQRLIGTMGIRTFALGAVGLGGGIVIAAAAVSQLRISYSSPGWLVALLLVAVFVVFATYAHLVHAIDRRLTADDGTESAHALAPS